MGYFLQKFGINIFNEAEVDNQDMDDPNNQSSDYTAEDNNTDNQAVDQQAQDANNQTTDEPQVQDQTNDMTSEEGTTDYSAEDAAAGDEPFDGENQEAPPQDGGEEEQPVDDIKQQEEELYNNLTPDQLDIRHKELKTQFLNMYDITTSIIDKIGDANTNEDNIGVVEYISDNLSRLRTMLIDYIENVYAGKSYIENSINYNRFLAVLNGINKLLEELDKKQDK